MTSQAIERLHRILESFKTTVFYRIGQYMLGALLGVALMASCILFMLLGE